MSHSIQIYLSDCLEFLSKIPAESVDLVLVDPPYYQISKEKWDNQWKSEKDYLDFCAQWTWECNRVLKVGGLFSVWGTTKHDTFLRYKLEVLNNISDLEYQNWIIWHYDWGGRTKKSFPRKHEDCLVYSKGKDFYFDADSVRIPYKMTSNIRKEAANNPKGKVPTDVWEKNIHTTSKEYVSWHPHQKPLMILERLIQAYCPPDGIVLDCFSGSGSTAIACINTKRNFLGSELNADYYKKSLERIDEWQK